MARLSIIIPLQGTADLMESGLVSVLENRPSDCEVLVVLNASYDDPYNLQDEVRFVRAAEGASWTASVNVGVEQSRAPIVHLMQSGVQATEGWADRALAHFDDDDVAAVAPLVVHPYKPSHVQAACVAYGAGGCRIVHRGKVRTWTSRPCWPVLAPTCLAGFYRRRCWETLGGMACHVGDELADVDFGLRQARLGWRTFLDPRVVVKSLHAPPAPRGFSRGVFAQRLFLRNIPTVGWIKSLLLHPLSVALQNCASLKRLLAMPADLAGRLSAWRELSAALAHHAHMHALAQKVALGDDRRRDGADVVPVVRSAVQRSYTAKSA